MKVRGKTLRNEDIIEYTISNGNLELSVLNYGAIITGLKLANGKDVVLGFDKVEDYIPNVGNLSVVVVPNANRIGGAKLIVDDKQYALQVNNNENNLHSHNLEGGHKQIWQVEEKENQLILTCNLSEQQDLFPANRSYKTVYTLKDNDLVIDYYCTSDGKTVFNPTQHAYFNLNGHDSGKILNHKLQLNCSYFTPTDSKLIPTGEIISVKGTPMDFTEGKEIGKDIRADYTPLVYGHGYDHNFAVDNYDGSLQRIGALENDETVMTILSTQPAIQVYTGNHLGVQIGKGGYHYSSNDGVALETQFFPDATNHENFLTTVIEPNKEYHYQTIYRFESK